MPSAPVLLWFRQDLRLADHAALNAALATGRPVLAAYVLDTESAGRWAPGGASRWWLHHSLAALRRGLEAASAPLVLRRGESVAALCALAGESGAAEVYCGAALEPWARAVEERAHAALAARGVGLRRFRTATLFDPTAIRTRSGGAYGVYTPFARACFAAPPPPAPGRKPRRIPAPENVPRGEQLETWGLLPVAPDWAGGLREAWQPGEAGAHAALARFLDDAVGQYHQQRDLPARAATSRLSPHLHFGEISAATVWHAALAAGDGAGVRTFLQELLWREFSAHLLWHHPTLPEAPLRAGFAAMAWRDAPVEAGAWRRGRTGVPIVDAGMRQLWRTGWMHNRVRMIAASFLVKHLLIDWRVGQDWFWDTLVDADLASNAASWQWVAGSGADAAPFFRVFNPVLQGRKFDPDGAYVRRFVPELARLPAEHVHAPWEAPEAVLSAAGLTLGRDYPRPIVDLAAGRARALAALRAMTGGDDRTGGAR